MNTLTANGCLNPSLVYIREARAELKRAWRSPGFIIPTLMLPLGFYALFGIALTHRGSGQSAYTLATYGVYAAMAPCLFGFGSGVANDRDSGILRLKQVSPLPPAAFLVARLATAMAFTLAVLFGLYALAIFGAGVRMSAEAWALLIAVHLAGVAPICLLGLSVGLRAQSSTAIAITNILYFGLSVLGGLWIPIFEYPRIMQEFAAALPTTHLAALALGAAGQPTSGHAMVHLAAVAGFTAWFAVIAWRGWAKGLR